MAAIVFTFLLRPYTSVLQKDLTLPRQMTIAYGGDFKVSRKVLLNFAIRTVYQEQLQFKNLLPVVSLALFDAIGARYLIHFFPFK